ncbi:Lcl domain-containing protein [Coraliomargarita sp. W4R72]
MHHSIISGLCSLFFASAALGQVTYPIVDTAQDRTYNDRSEITYPQSGDAFYGQDAQYAGAQPSYQDNGDGTVSDQVTGLMWTQDPGEKMSLKEAVKNAASCRVGGHDDWRLPTIKELYSLIQLNGTDPDPMSRDESNLKPFIDESVFKFTYGKEENDERIIDSQFATSTKYVSTTMRGAETLFGVNFADGRIKGYGLTDPRGRGDKTFFVLYVRGNSDYGTNKFVDNGDGTITDEATGLTWMQADSATGMDWPSALEYAENLELAGHSDWRLPNAKELQSIIDYTRSPDTTDSAAIDPIFEVTPILNEGGKKDYANYWTSSTHAGEHSFSTAVYFSFGRSLGFMTDRRTGEVTLMDVHGAGSQRSDPKVGDASKYPQGRGPQGDVIRIENMVRCVRGGDVEIVTTGPIVEKQQPSTRKRAQNSDSVQQPKRNSTAGADFMSREDRNKDGKVSKEEFRGPEQHFSRLDANGDGFITAEEAPTGPPNKK